MKEILNNDYTIRTIKKYENVPEIEKKNQSIEKILKFEYVIEPPEDKFKNMYNDLYNHYSLYKNKFIECASNLILITKQYTDLEFRYKILRDKSKTIAKMEIESEQITEPEQITKSKRKTTDLPEKNEQEQIKKIKHFITKKKISMY
jgi:hypothetical protein